MQANAGGGGELGTHAVIRERHGVVTRLGAFRVMAEARSIARERLVDGARIEPHVAGDWHHEYITEIRMSRSGKMRVREPKNRRVPILVSGRPGIALLEMADLRIRAELHHAERHDGTGKSVSVVLRADERINRRHSRIRG